MAAPVEPTLQLSREEMRSYGYRVIDLLIDHFDRLRDKPVTRIADRTAFEQVLTAQMPDLPTPLDEVLDQVGSEVFSNIMLTTHPRFFAYVPGPSNFVSALADALVAGYNPFVGTWLEASGPSEVELITLDWVRQLCGMPESAGGLFVSGGSMANLTGLAAARQARLGEGSERAVIYFSDQTHASVDKALRILGFRADQMRRIPCDAAYRMPLADLRRAVDIDRASGRRPFCIVANAGTTNTGAVDPLEGLAAFAQSEDLWLHVDGAYGAAAILTEPGRSMLSGLGQVDSLAVDPHKWLFQPYEIGCVLVKDVNLLHETFQMYPEYLQDLEVSDREINFFDYGIQLTRSFRALKLWMSLKVFGLDAFRKAISRGIELAEAAQKHVEATAGLEIVTHAQLAILTFRYYQPGFTQTEIDRINSQIVTRVIEDGFAMINSTVLRGRTVLRMCTINPRTTEADIFETLNRIAGFGDEIVHS